MNAVDTNVLVYAQDPRDPRKRQIAAELIENAADGVLLWQVACEYVAASRKLVPFGFSVAEAWRDLAELRASWSAALPTWDVHERTERIMGKHGLSIWDALLVAASAEFGVQRLYSEDFGNLNSIDGVQIVNPFA
jgi:predicted nucleic acid-binding protein